MLTLEAADPCSLAEKLRCMSSCLGQEKSRQAPVGLTLRLSDFFVRVSVRTFADAFLRGFHLDVIHQMERGIALHAVGPPFHVALCVDGVGHVREVVQNVECYGTHHPLPVLAQFGAECCVPHPFRGVHRWLFVSSPHVELQVGVEVNAP